MPTKLIKTRPATELAAKLKLAAGNIEAVARELDRSFAPCPHCGTRRMNNFNEYQMGVELDAMASKLRRLAESGTAFKEPRSHHADQEKP